MPDDAPGAGRRRRGRRGDKLLVLGFHNVDGTWCWPSAAGEGVSTFLRQMKVLDRIANVVPLQDALDALAAGRPLPPRAVALTFDDGYRDNLTLAAPILRRFSMPATVYLVPNFLSRKEYAWWERLGWAVRQAGATHLTHDGVRHPLHDADARVAALRVVEDAVKERTHADRQQLVEQLVEQLRPSGDFGVDRLFLDWDSARELVGTGLTIGSHTLDHAILARETPDDQRHNLRESRETLQRELQVEVGTLAYPNGKRVDYDSSTIDAAHEAGYSYAVTTWGSPVVAGDEPYEIHRTLISPSMGGARFAAKLAQQLLPA